MGNHAGRKREYGAEVAQKTSVSWDSKLLTTFRAEAARRGCPSLSRAVQNAARLWLQIETHREESISAKLGKLDKSTDGHIHVRLPKEFWEALSIHAARIGRTITELAREGLALYVRANSEAPEFRDVEEWRFLGSEDPEPAIGPEIPKEIRDEPPPAPVPEAPQ